MNFLKRHKDVQTLVLDTSAFIMGFNPSILETPSYTTTSVFEELDMTAILANRIATAEKSGKLKIIPPSAKSVEKIQEVCQILGEQVTLSETDITVLALALDLKAASIEPLIISDDFAVQNVSEYLQISYRSMANRGIEKLLDWTLYCPACFKKYHIRVSVCSICGTQLKRRPSKSSRARFKN